MGELIKELQKCNNYDIALFTTFNIDLDFFETFIVKQFFDNKIKNISLFVDANQLRKSISINTPNMIGRYYSINPIEMKSAFHPKIILLMNENSAKLFVLSANLTFNAYYFNSEIYQVFDFNKNREENSSLIKKTVELFNELNNKSVNKNDELINKMNILFTSYKIKDVNSTTKLVYNLKSSIYSQIKDEIGKCDEIDIAVPYYDKETKALETIASDFDCNNINLFLQDGESTYPKEKLDMNYNFIPFKRCEGSKYFYHGKVFLFKKKDISYILYGSANCTVHALMLSYEQTGNVECCIFECGEYENYKNYFEQFEKIDIAKNEIKCNTIEPNYEENNRFKFSYGYIDKEYIVLRIIADGENPTKIEYLNRELSYNTEKGNIEIRINKEELEIDKPVIELKIYVKESNYILKCWYIDNKTLSYNRLEKKKSIREIDYEKLKNSKDYNSYYSELFSFQYDFINLVSDRNIEYQFLEMNSNDIDNDISENEESYSDKDAPLVHEGGSSYIENDKKLYIYNKYKEYRLEQFKDFILNFNDKKKENVSQITKQDNVENDKTEKILKKSNAGRLNNPLKRLTKKLVDSVCCNSFYNKITLKEYYQEISILLNFLSKIRKDSKMKNMFIDKDYSELNFKLLVSIITKLGDNGLEENELNAIINYILISSAAEISIYKNHGESFDKCNYCINFLLANNYINRKLDNKKIIIDEELKKYGIVYDDTSFSMYIKNFDFNS